MHVLMYVHMIRIYRLYTATVMLFHSMCIVHWLESAIALVCRIEDFSVVASMRILLFLKKTLQYTVSAHRVLGPNVAP